MNAEIDKSRQVVNCGAAVAIDDPVMQHGIAFLHPELPLFKLHFQMQPDAMPKFVFEIVKPESADVKQFTVVVQRGQQPPEEPKIVMPEQPKLIIPGA